MTFYKEQYEKSLAARTEIDGSLSTPIGILTALLAGLYFCTTNFDYHDHQRLTLVFTVMAVLCGSLLIVAIILLAMVFAQFFRGRDYFILNDADVLNDFYLGLLNFYQANPPQAGTAEDAAQSEFMAYLSGEYIRNAANNQQINRLKSARRFQSNRFMIYALISLSLLIIPFGIDFGTNKGKEKVQKVKIDQALPVDLQIKYKKDTTERLLIKPEDDGSNKSNNSH